MALIFNIGGFMGIFGFLKQKFDKDDFTIDTEVLDSENGGEKQFALPKFVPLSMYELQDADWDELGKRLKFYKLLPNSYDTAHPEVEVALDKNGIARAFVTFKSKTSDSVRRYDFYQSKEASGEKEQQVNVQEEQVYEWVNGVCRTFDGNKERNELLEGEWRGFVTYLNLKKDVQKRKECTEHVVLGDRMIKQGKRLTKFFRLIDQEKQFLEEHANDEYVAFVLNGPRSLSGPAFLTTCDERGDEEFVKPFTPKTLEFCVTKLTDEAKLDENYDIEYFIEKCREIKGDSLYNTPDWDKAIDSCIEIVEECDRRYTEEQFDTMESK